MWTAIFDFIAGLLGKELSVAAERQRSADKLKKQRLANEKKLAEAYAAMMAAQEELAEARRKNQKIKDELRALNEQKIKLDLEKMKVDVPENPY
jgi:hypothetical protein